MNEEEKKKNHVDKQEEKNHSSITSAQNSALGDGRQRIQSPQGHICPWGSGQGLKTCYGPPPYQEGRDHVILFLVLSQNYLIHSTDTYWGPTTWEVLRIERLIRHHTTPVPSYSPERPTCRQRMETQYGIRCLYKVPWNQRHNSDEISGGGGGGGARQRMTREWACRAIGCLTAS